MLSAVSCVYCQRTRTVDTTKFKCNCLPQEESKKEWPKYQTCIHRKEFIGKLNCNCAQTYPVYECSVHNTCCNRPTVYTWTDFEGNISPPPKGCSTCQEKQFGPDKPA